MKYLSNKQREKLPLPENDNRPRFFIDLYTELLCANTLISFQPRIMNVFTYASEILELLSFYEKHRRGKSQIERNLKEFLESIKNDDAAKVVFENEIMELGKIDINNLTDLSMRKLSLIMKLLLDVKKQDDYWDNLKKNVVESICGEYDSKQLRRSFDKINDISKLLVSYMLNNFGTATYLFNKGQFLLDQITMVKDVGVSN